jgi:hypothetical protein
MKPYVLVLSAVLLLVGASGAEGQGIVRSNSPAWTKMWTYSDSSTRLFTEYVDQSSFEENFSFRTANFRRVVALSNGKVVATIYTTMIVDCSDSTYTISKGLEVDDKENLIQLMQIGDPTRLSWVRIVPHTIAEEKRKLMCERNPKPQYHDTKDKRIHGFISDSIGIWLSVLLG